MCGRQIRRNRGANHAEEGLPPQRNGLTTIVTYPCGFPFASIPSRGFKPRLMLDLREVCSGKRHFNGLTRYNDALIITTWTVLVNLGRQEHVIGRVSMMEILA
jgi:hypothetical protein